MHACVLGAGVIGVSTAWQLAQAGWQVTLVDAAEEAAAGCSHANGGQLSYRYVAPLAEPGVLPELPRWLFSATSSLRFRPRLDTQQWRWCLRFLRACNARTAARSAQALLALAELSRQALAELQDALALDFALQDNGKLIVYRSTRQYDKARRQLERDHNAQAHQRALDAYACVALEPALAPVRQAIAGAIHTPGEQTGDCRRFTQALWHRLAQHPGVTLRMGTRVTRLQCERGRIREAGTATGQSLHADHFVLAAGLGSRALLASLGLRAPLYPLVGYSLSVSAAAQCVPTISVTDYARRTVYAPLGTHLRIAAMVGVGVRADHLPPARIARLKRQVHELLPGLPLDDVQPWVGARPATPTGLPLIGRTRHAGNLWLNIGHGALGFTLACGSARLLTSHMTGAAPAVPSQAFAPPF